ncbi:ran GTPase-binding protein mog1 [Grosmannia clavigera kw1407]|uniref:Ran GTPase-binding protein mog1 n=1 Tax=Grosmannia clavigera (strain kw1407 / UAMH 11150) TaxID=655863 RepID=F0XEG7_GROCL|nr:ran GTPase-binding protein mog1 [Grosmannia clavigera kw1407]EFX03758.1 ran GTPase-binding protein mog1 [Grosmannia clavigera kw1407]
MTKYHETPLFGGAMAVDLPEKFADVSKLRQVPDNQEVYIDKDGFTSIIVEICERVGPAGNSPEIDGQALSTHLEELVGDDVDTVRVWNTTETQFSELTEEFPAYTLIATQTPVADPKSSSTSAPDFTAIVLTLLRLEKHNTDLLVTINVPHMRGEYDEEEIDLALGKQGELIGDAIDYASHIWATLRIDDWKLFKSG